MRWLMVLGLLLRAGVTLAGNQISLPDGNTGYYLRYMSYDGKDIVNLYCADFRYMYPPDVLERLEPQAVEAFGTDSIMLCTFEATSGTPYAYPTDIDYLHDGINYRVGYRNYQTISGDVGRLRAGGMATFIIALEAPRGESFMLFFRDDSVEAILAP
jgi:hypothetical protein